MMLKGILQFAHQLLEESVERGETVIDATCGNGNDTLFLSKTVGDDGHVFAFDIQEQALQETKALLTKHGKSNVSLIHDSHEHVEKYVHNEIGGAIFNLGYLPRSDKRIITKPDTTIAAIDAILNRLKKNKLVVIVVYHGHEGGKEEKEAVLNYCMALDQKKFSVLQYRFINQVNHPPFLLAIQKK